MTTPPPGKPGRPEVEELSDLSWARVERRLWAELDRAPAAAVVEAPRAAVGSSRRWWLAAGALAAAAVIAVVAWPSSSPSTHRLSSRVATASDATEVSFGDASITVAPSSAVLLDGHADRGVSIVLERGSADFAVAPRVGRPPFVVHAGAVQVRVIGTRFRVSRSGDDARVVVTHGEVEVVAWGRREVLLAGASWSSDGVREAAVGGSAPVTNPGTVAAAHFSPSPETGPTLVPASRPPAASRPPSTSAGPAAADEPPVAPSDAGQVVELIDDAQSRYDTAVSIEKEQPAEALRLFRQVAAGSGTRAANALYAAAMLSYRMGERENAVKWAKAYLIRFPKGINADDARGLITRITGASP